MLTIKTHIENSSKDAKKVFNLKLDSNTIDISRFSIENNAELKLLLKPFMMKIRSEITIYTFYIDGINLIMQSYPNIKYKNIRFGEEYKGWLNNSNPSRIENLYDVPKHDLLICSGLIPAVGAIASTKAEKHAIIFINKGEDYSIIRQNFSIIYHIEYENYCVLYCENRLKYTKKDLRTLYNFVVNKLEKK